MHTVEVTTISGATQQFTLETPNDFNVIASSCNSNVCFFCDKTFTNVYNCRRHIRTHSGEKPFECKVCGKKFSRQSTLNAHEKVHTGNQIFKCDTCGEAFDVYRSLTEHQLTHRSDKPFTCKLCNKSYSRATVLSQHMKAHTTTDTVKTYPTLQTVPIVQSIQKVQTVQAMQTVQRVQTVPVTQTVQTTQSIQTVQAVPSIGQTDALSVTSIPFLEEPATNTTMVTVPIISQALYKCQQCEQMFVTPSELKDHEHVHIAAAKEDKQKAVALKEVVVVMKPEEPQVIQIVPQISYASEMIECVEPYVPHINTNNNFIGSVNNSISIINSTSGNTIGTTINGSSTSGMGATITTNTISNPITTSVVSGTTTTTNIITSNDNVGKIPNNNNILVNSYNNNINRAILGNPTQNIVPITALTITHPIRVVVIEPPTLQPVLTTDQLNCEFNYVDPITAQDDKSIPMECKVCSMCNLKFRYDVDLQNHMKMHVTPNDRYKCDVCDRRFSFLANFNAHKKIHEREKPYRCTVCGKSFRVQKSLTAHMLLHTETSFNCPVCDRTFSKHAHMKMHMKKHTRAEWNQPKRTYIDVMCFDDADDDLFEEDLNNNGNAMDFISNVSPTFCDICGEKFMQTHATLRTHKCEIDDIDDEEMEIEADEQLSSPEVWSCE